jgi:peptide/nickel transport system permease protein
MSRGAAVLVARRLLGGAVLLLLVSVIVFTATEVVPGDAAFYVAGRDATPEQLARVRAELNLDRSAGSRYVDWLSHAVRGDLGDSLVQLAPVSSYLGVRARNTLVLAGTTLALLIPLSLLLGGLAAVRQGRSVDAAVSAVTLALAAVPEFVVGILLVTLFAVHWRLLPAIASITFESSLHAWVTSLVLPAATLLAISLGHTVRLVRGSTIDALESEYVEAARLRGLPERVVVWRHALPNSLGPAVQVLALNAAWLIGGVVIVENVFNYPGLGQALVDALLTHDIPVVQAIACLLAAAYILVNVMGDLATLALTPRLRPPS